MSPDPYGGSCCGWSCYSRSYCRPCSGRPCSGRSYGIGFTRTQAPPVLDTCIPGHARPHRLQGESLHHCGSTQEPQDNLCSGAWRSSCAPSPLPCESTAQFLPDLLKHPIPEALPLSLMGSASAISRGPSWSWLAWVLLDMQVCKKEAFS